MNYDNLYTTAEILEAFQGCCDAGEEIDLFEALAWRDEPPVEAFIEIVRKIKLEPVLALATQALGWVKNVEVLERLKKSDELLEILSNLAKSGSTDLIRWSAAKSIIIIKFEFISISQYLTEKPLDTLLKLEERYENSLSSIDRYPIDFWIYCNTLSFFSLNQVSFVKAMELFRKKGIKAVKEINLLLREFLVNGTPDIFNSTMASQNFSEQILSGICKTENNADEFIMILLSNQIYCISSYHLEIRKSANIFLSKAKLLAINDVNLQDAVNAVMEVNCSINRKATDISINIKYFEDENFAEINNIIGRDFDNESKKIHASKVAIINMRSKLEKDIDQNDLANKIVPTAIVIFTISFIVLCVLLIPMFASIKIDSILGGMSGFLVFAIILIGAITITAIPTKDFLRYRKHLLNELKETYSSELSNDAKSSYINGVKKNRLDGVLQIKRLLEKRRKAYLYLTHQ
jgi:hypothetical protein